MNIHQIIEKLNTAIDQYDYGHKPDELYDPIRYIMNLGGKRVRPLLAVMAHSLYSDKLDEIIEPALAVEVFHNFSLVHDDIMDEAPIRRGKPTVHKKWNENIAILSGDVMLVKAYELLLKAPKDKIEPAIQKFNRCATEVCEGQQYDMNFETREDVSEEEYLQMIKFKTAVLLGYSLELGALIGNASEEDQAKIKAFGINVGIGFQLKDDLLDIFGDQDKVGKQVGGDIIANKKTYLLIKALELANPEQKKELEHWLNLTDFDNEEKVVAVKNIYHQIGIQKLTQQKVDEYFKVGFDQLSALHVDENKKQYLIQFTEELINRES